LNLSRVLIIKPSSLGDVIQALPVAWALRDLKPRARIDWLVMPSCAGAVEGVGAIDHVLLFDRKHYGRMWRNPLTAASFIWFLSKLRHPRYTTVVDLQGLFRSGFLAYASGAERRVGLAGSREGADRFYTDVVSVPEEPMSSVDRYMLAASALGAPSEGPRRFGIDIPPAKGAEAGRLLTAAGLDDSRPYVVLVPGGRWPTKRWPEERYAALAQRIAEQLGLAPVLLGAPGEAEIGARMRRMRGSEMIDLIGRTDIKTLAAVLRGAACVVTNDTGPMHLAAALGRPIVAIFGPTSVDVAGPYGRGHILLADRADCARCYRRSCLWEGQREELACQRNISVDEVFDAVRRQLGVRGERGRRTETAGSGR